MSGPPLGASEEQQDPGEENEGEYWETMRCAWADVMESAEARALAVTSATIRHRNANRPRLPRRQIVELQVKVLDETAVSKICLVILHFEASDMANSFGAQEAHGVSR
jgi:hypothetical protein